MQLSLCFLEQLINRTKYMKSSREQMDFDVLDQKLLELKGRLVMRLAKNVSGYEYRGQQSAEKGK